MTDSVIFKTDQGSRDQKLQKEEKFLFTETDPINSKTLITDPEEHDLMRKSRIRATAKVSKMIQIDEKEMELVLYFFQRKILKM